MWCVWDANDRAEKSKRENKTRESKEEVLESQVLV